MNHLLSSHHDHIQPGLQPWGAASLFGMALCYVTLFVIYGAVLPAPTANDMASKIHRLVEHQTLVQWTYIVGYILFACLLSIAVQTLHRRYGNTSLLINTTSLFGLFWVVVLLCTGMIGITVLELLSNQYLDDQANSQIVYVALVLLESALGGGIEFIGGMWVLLLGIAGWRYRFVWYGVCSAQHRQRWDRDNDVVCWRCHFERPVWSVWHCMVCVVGGYLLER